MIVVCESDFEIGVYIFRSCSSTTYSDSTLFIMAKILQRTLIIVALLSLCALQVTAALASEENESLVVRVSYY